MSNQENWSSWERRRNLPSRVLRAQELAGSGSSSSDSMGDQEANPEPQEQPPSDEWLENEEEHVESGSGEQSQENRGESNADDEDDGWHESPNPVFFEEGYSRNGRRPCTSSGAEMGMWRTDQSFGKKIIEVHVGEEAGVFMKNELKATRHLAKNLRNVTESKTEEWIPYEDRIEDYEYEPIVRDENSDKMLLQDMKKRALHESFGAMMAYRKNLPAYKMREEIIEFINKNQISIITGGTGCGKSTQIVQYILDYYVKNNMGSLCNIVCTEPRRISAISVAERVAAERCETLGVSIGYQIRLDNKIAWKRSGCINFVTTGTLLQWMNKRPALENISHVFLDEVHERTVESDIVMAFLKYVLPKRPDLKVILMSATVNTSSFSNYLNGAPQLNIPGLAYPVQELFLEDILRITHYQFRRPRSTDLDESFENYILPYVKDLEEKGSYPKSVTTELANPLSEELDIPFIADVVRHICLNEGEGSILVFLPGLGDLTRLKDELEDKEWFDKDEYDIIVVHSLLTSGEQMEAFEVPKQNARKIIISTSILETGVTVYDVSFVIDSGKRKLPGYEVSHNINTLMESWVSLANAQQRKGRTGRTKPGKCYKLYTRIREQIFEQYPTPEIMTNNLEQVILEAKSLKLQNTFPFFDSMMDTPKIEVIKFAMKALGIVGALDNNERLTALGVQLAKLATDPRAGKMILMGALFSCVDPIFSVAACLSFRDPFSMPFGQERELRKIKEKFAKGQVSDHFIFREILKQFDETDPSAKSKFVRSNFLSRNTLNLLSDMKRQYCETLYSTGFLKSPDMKAPINNINSGNLKLFKAIICAGLYPNVATLKNSRTLQTMHNENVRFHRKSHCSTLYDYDSIFFVYHYKLKCRSVNIHDASMISVLPLLLFGQYLKIVKEEGVHFLKVDDFIKVKMDLKNAKLLQKIRRNVNLVLKTAISNGQGFDWTKNEGNIRILKGVVKLITADEFEHEETYM